jgi:hypothetical protein
MWRVDNGTVAAPSSWAVEGGRLVQHSAIGGPAPAGLATGPGGALVFGELTWRNYQVGTTFEAAAGRVGLVAGYRDASNYYLASVDAATGEVEVARVLGGAWTRLALRTPSSPFSGTTHAISLTATGEWLQVSLDDEPLEPVYDSALPRGRAGLFTAGAAGAAFASLLVSGVPLYEFAFTTSRYARFQDQVASFQGPPARLRASAPLADVLPGITRPTGPAARYSRPSRTRSACRAASRPTLST